MPVISVFYGILIRMYFLDHNPPHFHAYYGEYEAIIDIQSLQVLEGALPKRAEKLTLEWAQQHQEELKENWELLRQYQAPKRIKPLED